MVNTMHERSGGVNRRATGSAARHQHEPNCNEFDITSPQMPQEQPAHWGSDVMGWMIDHVGRTVARYLERPAPGYEPFTPSDPDALRAVLKPGDVLLVEGNNHISGV